MPLMMIGTPARPGLTIAVLPSAFAVSVVATRTMRANALRTETPLRVRPHYRKPDCQGLKPESKLPVSLTPKDKMTFKSKPSRSEGVNDAAAVLSELKKQAGDCVFVLRSHGLTSDWFQADRQQSWHNEDSARPRELTTLHKPP